MLSLEVVNLCKDYYSKNVLNCVNGKFDSDKIYFLTSENGKGKTTFFKCLLNETAYSGDILDEGIVYAYLPEKCYAPDYASVRTFLHMFSLFDQGSYDDEYIDFLLKRFEITNYANCYINNLSKGTRQKVLIIKTLIANANCFLFDEPLEGLDQKSRKIFMEEVKKLQEEGKLVFIATHYYFDYPYENKEEVLLC